MNQKAKKILILGHGRHGKDTVAEIIHDLTGLTYTSSSRAMLDIIYPVLTLVTGITDKEELFEKRTENRELWKELINLYNAADKSALAQRICGVTDIYVGMRDDQEFEASRHLFDLILWVDAEQRHPPDPTMLIKKQPGMQWIDNNGDLDELWKQVKLLQHRYLI